jgi:hypothetical protein
VSRRAAATKDTKERTEDTEGTRRDWLRPA